MKIEDYDPVEFRRRYEAEEEAYRQAKIREKLILVALEASMPLVVEHVKPPDYDEAATAIVRFVDLVMAKAFPPKETANG